MINFKACLIWLFICALIPASAQWNLNGTNIYYNGGNVGIGMTAPTYKFGVINQTSRGDVQLVANSTSNVGIGTGSPSEKLHVNGQ